MSKRRFLMPLLALAASVLAVGLAACGGGPHGSVLAGGLAACGGSSKASGVELAPSSGATQAAVTTTPKPPPALAKKPVVTVPTGAAPTTLVTKDRAPGTGQPAKAGDPVPVNSAGLLYKTGKESDSSWSRNQPFTTALSTGSV